MMTRFTFCTVALGVLLASPMAFASTFTFQEHADGYTAANYATIQGSNATSSLRDWRLYAFGLPNNSSQQAGLLGFDDIFGTGSGQVPLIGETISSATLQFYVESSWGGDLHIYPMLTDWDQTTVTDSYRAYVGGSPTAYWGGDTQVHTGPVAGIDYDTSYLASTPIAASTDTWMTADITDIVRAWHDGSLANHGLVLFGSDAFKGMMARSPSNTGTAPILTIRTAVPEPATLGLMLVGGLAMLKRRRRSA